MSENGHAGDDGRPTVLVVDDEAAIVNGHAARIESRYDVRRAYSGEEALEQLDERVDLVLLARRMPDLTGGEVLSEVRERDLGCRVAMLTGVGPSVDIIDMGFDDFLRKPVGNQELLDGVDCMLQRVRYDRRLQEFFSMASKAAVLETEHDRADLERHDEYRRLQADLRRMREELDGALEDLPAKERYAVALGPNGTKCDTSDV